MNTLKNYFSYIVFTVFMSVFLINGCTHEDDITVDIPDSTFEYGDDVVMTDDGFNFDKTHSSVRWETAYLGSSALLTGRFNQFEFDANFDQQDLNNSSVSGTVVLSSVNTGEPGRDEGCLLNTFNTDVSDQASFTSTSISEDGMGGYDIEGELTFNGVTSTVFGKMEYIGTTLFDENSGVFGAPLNVAGFVIEFEFSAKSVFNIESGNIADRVKVIASGQFKQPI